MGKNKEKPVGLTISNFDNINSLEKNLVPMITELHVGLAQTPRSWSRKSGRSWRERQTAAPAL